MNDNWLWFNIGVSHILNLQGYDHILFITLLVLTYAFDKWARLFYLITAFTMGHCVSIILSANGYLHLRQEPVELVIALSIFTVVIFNLIPSKIMKTQKPCILYSLVCFFGVVHGLGFSYSLNALLGKGQSTVWPLLNFNLGLETGQLIIVLIVIVFSLLLTLVFNCPFKLYKLIIICLIGLISLFLSVLRLRELYF